MKINQANISIAPIIDVVATFYSVSPEAITSASRKQEIVRARHVTYYLARIKYHLSYPQISRALFRGDHSTVISGYKKISSELSKNEDLKNEIDYILSILDKSPNDQIPLMIRIQAKKAEKKRKAKLKRKKVFTGEQKKRMKMLLETYRIGWTYEDMAEAFKITRERIRQIIMAALEYEITESSSKNVSKVELEAFILKEKENHLVKRKEKYKKPEKVKTIRKIWCWEYDHCKMCGTTKVKHRSNGYCVWCYPKTEIFKQQQRESRLRNLKKRKIKEREYLREYSKRPEVIARMKQRDDFKRYGGNREKALKRDNYICQKCGMSKKESMEKLGRDLYVYHLNDKKDNRLENLVTLCQKCFNEKTVKLMHRGLSKRT